MQWINLLEQVRDVPNGVDADVMNFCIILYYLVLLMHGAHLTPNYVLKSRGAIISLWKVEGM